MNWKNLTLFGREILDDGGYQTLEKIIKTQMYGEPLEPVKGDVTSRMNPDTFKAAMSKFNTDYKTIFDGLAAKVDMLDPADLKKASRLLLRAETLYGLSNTHTEMHEAFRRANVQKGKDYTGTHTALWKRLEIAGGVQREPSERFTVTANHCHDYH